MENAILELFLQEGILSNFVVSSVEKSTEAFTTYLAEKNLHPQEFAGQKILSKGYYEEITLSDFPIRGKACFLKVKRRR